MFLARQLLICEAMSTRIAANDAAGVKDAEARIRALTREAGSLREELRREEKRRERAVAQVMSIRALHGSRPAHLPLPHLSGQNE